MKCVMYFVKVSTEDPSTTPSTVTYHRQTGSTLIYNGLTGKTMVYNVTEFSLTGNHVYIGRFIE